MIDKAGTVKIIDFGSVRVAGVAETRPLDRAEDILGTAQYTAPEYFLGESGSVASDQFSLGVIAYQMLTGRLPYGAGIARARTGVQMGRLAYVPACVVREDVPVWLDGALRRAVNLDPRKRYEALSEFLHDLRNPNPGYLRPTPLIERNPHLFWQGLAFVLLCTNLVAVFFLRR